MPMAARRPTIASYSPTECMAGRKYATPVLKGMQWLFAYGFLKVQYRSGPALKQPGVKNDIPGETHALKKPRRPSISWWSSESANCAIRGPNTNQGG